MQCQNKVKKESKEGTRTIAVTFVTKELREHQSKDVQGIFAMSQTRMQGEQNAGQEAGNNPIMQAGKLQERMYQCKQKRTQANCRIACK